MAGGYDLVIRMTSRGTWVSDLRSSKRHALAEAYLSTFVETEGEMALAKIRAVTPVSDVTRPDHMHMIDNWSLVHDGPFTVRVINSAPHASFPFTGVRPHMQPNFWGKGIAFMHPGYPPNEELNAAQAEIAADVRRDFREIGGRGAATALFSTRLDL